MVTFAGLVLGTTNNPASLLVTSPGLVGTTTSPVIVSAPAVLAFAVGSVAVNENAGVATIQVVRTGGYQGPVSVQVATSGGTAVANFNYTPINVTLNFAAGQDSQSVTVPVADVGVLTTTPTVNILLSSPGVGATLANPSSATLSILNNGVSTQPAAPTVKLGSVQVVKVKSKHKPAKPVIVLGFSGGLNAAEAASIGDYELIMAGKKKSFTAKNAKVLKLASAVYNAANDTVTLTTKKKLVLTKPVELIVHGTAPSGLEDSNGHLINGGSNAVAVLQGKTATITAVSVNSAMVDALLENGDLAASARHRKS